MIPYDGGRRVPFGSSVKYLCINKEKLYLIVCTYFKEIIILMKLGYVDVAYLSYESRKPESLNYQHQ